MLRSPDRSSPDDRGARRFAVAALAVASAALLAGVLLPARAGQGERQEAPLGPKVILVRLAPSGPQVPCADVEGML